MRIPKTFQLGGRTWRVKRGYKAKKWYGKCDDSRAVIKIAACAKDEGVELLTFYHELLHAITGAMGFTKLNDDEDKIDAMASLLAQFDKTKR